MDQPLVSVIMPAFNAELFIDEAIQTVLNQTYYCWELIVINDGSTDNTCKIVNKYSLLDHRIKLLHQKNGKQGKARNYGISESLGNYIAFLDADDLWEENKLQIQVDFLTRNEDIDLVFSQGYSLENANQKHYNVIVKSYWDEKDIPLFIDNNQIPILSVLMKKSSLLQANNFTENPKIQNAEDYHLWLKLLLKKFKFSSLENRLFTYRLHECQSTYDNDQIPQIVNMFIDLHQVSRGTSYSNFFLQRVKWHLFDKKYHFEILQLLGKLKHLGKLKRIILSLSTFIPSLQLRAKTLFHLI